MLFGKLAPRTFPTCTRQCVVVVGGENGDEARRKTFSKDCFCELGAVCGPAVPGRCMDVNLN